MDTLYYFWPERGRLQTMHDDQETWVGYRQAAEAAGLSLEAITVDDVDMLARPDGDQVFVRGQLVPPDRAVFHNKLYTWPMFAPDTWRYLSTFTAIEKAGYCTLIPQELNVVCNDKATTLAYLRETDAQWVPTLTIPTRDFDQARVKLADAGIDFPVVVKPAAWGYGMGVTRAADENELDRALRLASAAELTMVVQRDLSHAGEFVDLRVLCVDRRPVGALRRTPARPGAVANVTRGGRFEITEVPTELLERSAAVARKLDLPWLGVDFLLAADGYYLSEVEVDACMTPAILRTAGATEILNGRFLAYRADLERWLARRKAADGN
jgi:glutathione synthase/RimK-type ligase-like ATP-grasp enzyme